MLNTPKCASLRRRIQPGFLFVLGLLPVCSAGAFAQNGVIVASQAGGNDICRSIQKSFIVLPAVGGTVDARGYSSNQTCASNPFASVHAYGTVLLPCATVHVRQQWTIPDRVHVIGCARGDSGAMGTTILWDAEDPPPVTGVVRLGDGSKDVFGTVLQRVTVDCNGRKNSVGIFSNEISEQSGLDQVEVANCSGIGINIDGTGPGSHLADNFFLHSIEVYPNAASTSATMGIKFVGNTSNGADFSNITVNAGANPKMGTGILIANTLGGIVRHYHCENSRKCLQIGDAASGPSLGLIVQDLTDSRIGKGNTVVEIDNPETRTISLHGITSEGSAHIIVDSADSLPAIDDFDISVFATGSGSAPRNILTTSSAAETTLDKLGTLVLDNAKAIQSRDKNGVASPLLQLFSDNKTYVDGGSAGAVFRSKNTAVTAGSYDSGGNWSFNHRVIFGSGLDNNGAGFKHKRGTAGCATAPTLGASCSTTITWTSAFADTNYTVFGCVGNGVISGAPMIQGIRTKTRQSIMVQTLALTAAAARFNSIECSAVHD